MKRRVTCAIIVFGFIGVILGQACSEYGMMSGSAGESSVSTLTLNAVTTILAAGAQTQLIPSGGQPPYTFQVTDGGGSVTAGGLYTAPPSVSTTATSATATVFDFNGQQASVLLYLNPSGLTVTYSPNSPTPGSPVRIDVLGGTPPIKFQIRTGTGSMSTSTSNIYLSSSTAETVVIDISDLAGLTAIVTIPIGTTGLTPTAVVGLFISPMGKRLPGGGGCPGGIAAGYTLAGLVADWDPIMRVLFGDQAICTQVGTANPGTQVATDIWVSTPNTHYNMPGCDFAGYTLIGHIKNCAGSCFGEQAVCVKYETAGANVKPVLELRITPEAVHAATAPTCPPGFDQPRGYNADCGFGTCSGYQTWCTRH